MRRSPLAPLDRNQFPLMLAGGLRATFAEEVSGPLPELLAALVSRVDANQMGVNHGSHYLFTSSGTGEQGSAIDRHIGGCGTAQHLTSCGAIIRQNGLDEARAANRLKCRKENPTIVSCITQAAGASR